MLLQDSISLRSTARGFYRRLFVGTVGMRGNTMVPRYKSYYRRRVECRILLRLTV